MLYGKLLAVLRIQIRDPVLFVLFYPWIRDTKKPDPPEHISESLETIFWVKIFLRRSGSGIFLTRDPGWKNFDLESGINIPNPQHGLLAPIGKTVCDP